MRRTVATRLAALALAVPLALAGCGEDDQPEVGGGLNPGEAPAVPEENLEGDTAVDELEGPGDPDEEIDGEQD